MIKSVDSNRSSCATVGEPHFTPENSLLMLVTGHNSVPRHEIERYIPTMR